MLDNITSLLKTQIGKIISGEKEIPAGKKDNVTEIATSSILQGLKNFKGGKEGTDIMALLGNVTKGGSSKNPLQNIVENTISSTLVSKAKLDKNLSAKLAGLIAPVAMSLLNKESKKGGGIDIGSLLGGLTGGSSKGNDSNPLSKLGDLFKK